MKTNIIIACMAILFLASCQGLTKKAFEITSDQFNKQCPMTIDEFTIMDSTSYSGKDNQFKYFYSLTLEQEDSLQIATIKEDLEKNIPEVLKKTEDMKAYKAAEVTLVYTYFSGSTKEKLFEINIPADKY